MRIQTILSLAATTGACALLAGCISPQRPLSPDYAMAVRSNIAAQTADPEARYRRDIEPASNGDRINTANERYEKGEVIVPEIERTRTTK
jgi:hypothetical protein